jgi:hypothetical protein
VRARPDGKWRKWRPDEERTKRLSGFQLPESQADWVERIAEAEDRSVPEVVQLLVQQGLKIYRRGSLLCDWPDCNRYHCCGGGERYGAVEERPHLLRFPPASRTDPDRPQPVA